MLWGSVAIRSTNKRNITMQTNTHMNYKARAFSRAKIKRLRMKALKQEILDALAIFAVGSLLFIGLYFVTVGLFIMGNA